MKKLLAAIVIVLLISFNAHAWMVVSWPHGTVVNSDQTNNYDPLDFVMPEHFDMVHWDNWQIVLTDPGEVWLIINWLTPVTTSISYIPERRDCDDYAIITKAVLAYEGFGNAIGLVIDYTKAHAYNCYWWRQDDGKIVLRKIEPQVPMFPCGFPMDHEGVIYW